MKSFSYNMAKSKDLEIKSKNKSNILYDSVNDLNIWKLNKKKLIQSKKDFTTISQLRKKIKELEHTIDLKNKKIFNLTQKNNFFKDSQEKIFLEKERLLNLNKFYLNQVSEIEKKNQKKTEEAKKKLLNSEKMIENLKNEIINKVKEFQQKIGLKEKDNKFLQEKINKIQLDFKHKDFDILFQKDHLLIKKSQQLKELSKNILFKNIFTSSYSLLKKIIKLFDLTESSMNKVVSNHTDFIINKKDYGINKINYFCRTLADVVSDIRENSENLNFDIQSIQTKIKKE